VVAGKRYRGLPNPQSLTPFNLNREPPQGLKECVDALRGDPLPAFGDRKGIGNLKWPARRHKWIRGRRAPARL
jgi:hypothetical protein